MSDAKKPGRFTMLEACRPNNPPPGSEAWPVVELANAVEFGPPPAHGLSEPVVEAVLRLDAAGLRSLRALIDERLREIAAGSPDPAAS